MKADMTYMVTTFYKFMPLQKERLGDIQKELEQQADKMCIQGLVLIAEEGINATITGSENDLKKYKEYITDTFRRMTFKDSVSDRSPFKRFKVKIKEEIVQLQRTDIRPTGNEAHLSPEEWDRKVEAGEMILIDVRNWYEAKLGTFKNAINPKTWTFSQFPDWLKKSDIPKAASIGIFCTGGIRCEKAAVAMQQQGYENVQQLDGGVLNYIEKCPNKNFEGDCFVFDRRVAVGQGLKPSTRYSMCPHCGNGGGIDQVCRRCEVDYRVCEECLAKAPEQFCSKNCRYQYSLQTSNETSN